MSSESHRYRLSVLHALARLGSATATELTAATKLRYYQVTRALCHRWFEPGELGERPRIYRLTADGQAAEASAQEAE